MSKRWGLENRSDHGYWVDQIKAVGCNLTNWEEEFVEDMDTKIRAGLSLSTKQAEILERIYAQRTP